MIKLDVKGFKLYGINGIFCKEDVNSTKNHVVLKEKDIQEMFYYNDIYSLLLTISNPSGKT